MKSNKLCTKIFTNSYFLRQINNSIGLIIAHNHSFTALQCIGRSVISLSQQFSEIKRKFVWTGFSTVFLSTHATGRISRFQYLSKLKRTLIRRPAKLGLIAESVVLERLRLIAEKAFLRLVPMIDWRFFLVAFSLEPTFHLNQNFLLSVLMLSFADIRRWTGFSVMISIGKKLFSPWGGREDKWLVSTSL